MENLVTEFTLSGAKKDDPESIRLAVMLNLTGLILALTSIAWGLVDWFYYDRATNSIIELTVGFVGVAFVFLHRRIESRKVKIWLFSVALSMILLVVNLFFILDYGVVNSNTPWLFLIPLTTFFVAGIQGGIIWSLVVFIWLLVFSFLNSFGYFPYVGEEYIWDVLSVFVLISLLSFLYEKARKSTQELYFRKNKEMERFVYVVSHDLRSPLTSLRGYLEEMEREHEEGEGKRFKEDIEKTRQIVKNMGGMIDDLLVFCRVRREKYEREEVPIGRLLDEVLANFEIQLEEKGFEVRVKKDLPVLKVYKRPLMEVFGNLISNAIKFTAGKNSPRIEIGCVERGGEYSFYVRDNGIGIPKEEQEKLFELFYRRGEQAGAGIGLSVVKEYVEMQGGRVWVESKAGRGSTFWFTLSPE